MHPPYSGYGYQFGYEVLTQLRELGLLMRGVKTRPGEGGLDYYGIIRESVSLEIPAVIIEHCHVDEAHDEGFCGSAEQLELFGRMDATAVAKYFGLKSSVLNVDYSGHQLADTGSEEQLDALLNARTAPETCRIQFMDADYENGKLTLSVSGADHDSALLYYSYSIDGGETFCKRETWPEGDGLSGSYRDSFVLELDIPPGVCPEVVVRAYNGFDIYTESNHYESPSRGGAFPGPGAFAGSSGRLGSGQCGIQGFGHCDRSCDVHDCRGAYHDAGGSDSGSQKAQKAPPKLQPANQPRARGQRILQPPWRDAPGPVLSEQERRRIKNEPA